MELEDVTLLSTPSCTFGLQEVVLKACHGGLDPIAVRLGEIIIRLFTK